MEQTTQIPREFIQEILRKEKDHRRFEEFVANIFSASEKIKYTTTAPTGDKGRDAYAELADGFAVACATTVQRDIKNKIRSDIDKHHASPLFVLRFRYCSNLSLDEDVRDEMVAYAKTKLPKQTAIMVLGLTQIVDRAVGHQDVFERTYSRELALLENFSRRTVDDQVEQEQSDTLKVILACAFHPEVKEQRDEVVRNLLFSALKDERPKQLNYISENVAKELELEKAPREFYLVTGIQRLIDTGELKSTPHGYVLTETGVMGQKSQLAAAAADALNGRELFLERVGAADQLLTDSQKSSVWKLIQTELASRFMYGGMRFVQELRTLGASDSSKSKGPEIQTFLSDMIAKVEGMSLLANARLAIAGAIRRFGDPQDDAFVWLSQIAVKYLVLCTLGLDPEVERQIQKRFSNWIIAPDTHMLLSYLCEGDSGHPQCAGVLNALRRASAGIVVAEAVLEEAVHHAKISHKNLDDLEQRYLQARKVDPGVKPYDLIASRDNAYVKSFAFLSSEKWKRGEWSGYIGQFYGHGSLITLPMRKLLEKELAAEHPSDSEEILSVGRGYARHTLGKLAEIDEVTSRKAEWDGRLLAAMMERGKKVPLGKRLILVTDASSLRSFYESSSYETHRSFQLSRPATLAYALMFAPGSHMNLGTVQRLIFATGRHAVSLKSGLTLQQVLPDGTSRFRRSSVQDLDSEDRLIGGS